MKLSTVTILEHTDVGNDYRILVFDAPQTVEQTRPGQFVHLRIPNLETAVLRRPFSIYGAHGNALSILYKAVGRGTACMTHLQPGDSVNLIGPLGNGFPTDIGDATPALIAGGFGVAPLCLVAGALPRTGVVFIGGRTADDILLAQRFLEMRWDVRVATVDGSLGEKGMVTGPLDAWLHEQKRREQTVEMFACGPDGMLHAVSTRATTFGYRAWLSLDKHMGCGVGACLACVQMLRRPDGSTYQGRVCKDGPIFEAREIVWEV